MVGVLVTRPKDYGNGLALQLKQEGYAVWHEPFLRIQPLETTRPEGIFLSPLVLLTSRSVAIALEGREPLIADFLTCPCYCVGAQTRTAAAKLGFTQILSADGDGLQLAHLILEREKQKRPILHMCGQDQSDEPMRTLSEAGWAVMPWSLYKAESVESLSPGLCRALVAGEIHVALFFSVRTAQCFVKLIQEHRLEACCKGLFAIGLSNAVVRTLDPLPLQSVMMASLPHQESVVARLHETFPLM